MDKFADILRDLIDDKELSLRKLAKESKVSAIQYSKYLRGSYPTIDVAVRIANYFECTLDYLFGISDNNKKFKQESYDISKFLPRYLNLLKEHNTTHWKFAKSINISESCLRHWQYGDKPKIETLIHIAMNLSCSIDYLIGRIDFK